jgi:hypothetical protein
LLIFLIGTVNFRIVVRVEERDTQLAAATAADILRNLVAAVVVEP